LRGNAHGLLVFTNLLAHCDKHGEVDIHPRAIAEEVGLTVDQVRVAIGMLEQPDAESRSPELEGRRIVRLDEHRDWGWRVVNFLKYRAIRDEDDRREQNRLAQERWRNKNKPASAEGEMDKPIQKQIQKQKHEDIEHTHAPTAAGRVCGLMRQAGISDTNPGHPLLLTLLDAGCTDGEIAGAAKSAVEKRKGFAYVLGTLKRQREEAAAAVLHVGDMPEVMTPGQAASHARVMAVSPRLAARKPEPPKEILDVTARIVG